VLFNIQVLRAIAALLVVHAHAAGATGLACLGRRRRWRRPVLRDQRLHHRVRRGARSEPVHDRRLIRIVPIYWTSTIALYLLVLALPRLFHTTSSDPVLLVRSLAFLPTASGVHTRTASRTRRCPAAGR